MNFNFPWSPRTSHSVANHKVSQHPHSTHKQRHSTHSPAKDQVKLSPESKQAQTPQRSNHLTALANNFSDTPNDNTWAQHLPKNLQKDADAFSEAGKKYNVDPKFLAAISMNETGNGTSNAYRNKNNAMGISGKHGPRRFESTAASIDSMARQLAKPDGYYKNKTKISEIAGIYCPVGAANDRGHNHEWLSAVTKSYQKLGGDPSQSVIHR